MLLWLRFLGSLQLKNVIKLPFNRLARELQSYFGKSTEKPSIHWQKSHAQTQLNDVQRRIAIYLHALCGIDFVIKSIEDNSRNYDACKPFVESNIICLPAFYYDFKLDDDSLVTGLEIYRAAAVHAAAHIVYTKHPLSEKLLSKWQKAVISVVEDARVETLLIHKFPLLKQLWCVHHTATPLNNQKACDYLNRLARALLDDTYQDEDPWVIRGRLMFSSAENIETNNFSVELGLKLADAFLFAGIKFNARTDKPNVPYRDDNRYLWAQAIQNPHHQELPDAFFESRYLLAGNNDFSCASEENKKISEGKPTRGRPNITTYFYPEWDYQSQIETPAWARILEKKPKLGDIAIIENIVTQDIDLVVRMKTLLHSIRFSGVRHVRKLEDGDEIDINAAIRSFIDLKLGVPPDTRIMMRSVRKDRDLSVLVLLDLSNSANQMIIGQGHTVFQLTQKICALFSEVLEAVGDSFSIHGFCSKTRHNIEYFRIKDFNQPYDDIAKAQLAGMKGKDSTRMGAAIRHATYHLNQNDSRKKLLLCITDGAPTDIDVRGSNYFLHDAKMAVRSAGRSGVHVHCVSLDPDADQYVSRIFGAKGYVVLDHVRSLPEKIFMMYARLTA